MNLQQMLNFADAALEQMLVVFPEVRFLGLEFSPICTPYQQHFHALVFEILE